jgi:hypothetical protein
MKILLNDINCFTKVNCYLRILSFILTPGIIIWKNYLTCKMFVVFFFYYVVSEG